MATKAGSYQYLYVARYYRYLFSHFKALIIGSSEETQTQFEVRPDTTSSNTLQFLASGKSAVVYGIDNEKVLKEFFDDEGGVIERRVYQKLGLHPRVAKLFDTLTDGSLMLERGNSLRTVCRSPFREISLQEKIRWLVQAAEGYHYLHTHNIIHGDVGCNNLIVARNGCVKLIDFEGCSIDGGPASSCYEWFSYRPSVPRVTRNTDIFAFGCAIYEVLAGRPPYHEFEKVDDPYTHVEGLYKNNQFPDVEHFPLDQIIYRCWHNGFSSMEDVARELKASPHLSFECREL